MACQSISNKYLLSLMSYVSHNGMWDELCNKRQPWQKHSPIMNAPSEHIFQKKIKTNSEAFLCFGKPTNTTL